MMKGGKNTKPKEIRQFQKKTVPKECEVECEECNYYYHYLLLIHEDGVRTIESKRERIMENVIGNVWN